MKLVTLLAALAVLCLAISVTPAAQTQDRWFVEFDARFLEPSGLVDDFALVDPDFDGNPEGTVQGVDLEADLAPRLAIGWLLEPETALTLSYWRFDQDRSSAVSGAPLWDILYSADDAFGEFTGTAMALEQIEASMIDLALRHPAHEGERLELTWVGGLRYARVQTGLRVDYDDTASTQTVETHNRADGLGLYAGISATLRIDQRWSVAGSFQYAFLAGDVDASSRNYSAAAGSADPSVDVRLRDERVINIVDFSVSAIYRINARYSVRAGYEFSQWNNALLTQILPDDVSDALLDSQAGDLAWNGLFFGAGVRF